MRLTGRKILKKSVRLRPAALLIAGVCSVLSGCNQIERPTVEPFYAVTLPPPRQELRWSNGNMPTSFDPARAAAPPETDLIRATYEGLTELDSRSLRPAPGVASSWESSSDNLTWTFNLRSDARWSNGKPVTAHDFVKSWKRLAMLGNRSANNYLTHNIAGMSDLNEASGGNGLTDTREAVSKGVTVPSPTPSGTGENANGQTAQAAETPDSIAEARPSPTIEPSKTGESKLGVTALDAYTLRVQLLIPDKDFPKLVSNPIFRPIAGDGVNFESDPRDLEAPTNGAFRISGIENDSITLQRSDTYWNRRAIALEQIKFIPSSSPEAAVEAYKRGDVDIVTNAAFEPVAVKLLAPFEDFRRVPHNALNFYEVNADRPPFSDRRIREALALAIDREKLAEGDLQGTTQPAYSFSPLARAREDVLNLDLKKAAELLDKAGYPGGEGFPPIRLVINRNDVQQRIAASVARMWKQGLNLDTVISVIETAEMENVQKSRDFDLLRRGVVLRTNSEVANLTAIRGPVRFSAEPVSGPQSSDNRSDLAMIPETPRAGIEAALNALPPDDADDLAQPAALLNATDEALFELIAIPLYFPTSYSLIKPYVRGFEMNGLDAPSLKEVSIDHDWQPKRAGRES